MADINENSLEQTTLQWLSELGYQILFGPDISPDGAAPERRSYDQVVLTKRLRSALERNNPNIPPRAIEDSVRKIIRTESPSLIENNRRFHRMLTDGVSVEYRNKNRRVVHDRVWLFSLDDPDSNEFLAVNQFTVIENRNNRRPDIVLFINGLPVAVLELKNPAKETTTIHNAFDQLQTYKQQIPGLFSYNELLVISDGGKARCGTLTSGWDRFMPWRTIDGKEVAPKGSLELETLLKGIFEKRRFLDLITNFIVFEDDGSTIAKKAAAYHQFHAVNKAVDCTLSACGYEAEPGQLYGRFPAAKEPEYGYGTKHFGKQRVGVIWHTQGSGKSLSMAFYAGKVIRHPAMENPTIVVITDRNDLDDQLYGTFSRCNELMRQTPVQAENRQHLRKLLQVPSGGVVFTTIQKFFPDVKGGEFPELSSRRNIVVIADEAHRSQYDFIDGFARHMRDALPNASFIGFTGTPIETGDRSTPAVFGDYIDTYDILRAVEDGATVPIYYEGRLAMIELPEKEMPRIDPEFEEITEGEEESEKQRLQTKWARLEAVVGAEKRISLVAKDLVEHFEDRLTAMDGKGLIVCMSRRICVEMYDAIIKLRPDWHSDDDSRGKIKIVMSGSASDRLEWQPHIRNKNRREDLAKRFKDPEDELKLVIVRDMWLTGFDCPALHTMYIDKPMRGHGLMQTIARVNRVFGEKKGGLVVDYLGLADQLKQALAVYTEAGGKGEAVLDQEEAVALMLEKYDIITAMYQGFDYSPYLRAEPAEKLRGMAAAMDHILGLEDGKKRYLRAVTALSRAFALSVPHPETKKIRDEVGFFQLVRSAIAKSTITGQGKTPEELDLALRQLVSKSIASDKVIDILAVAGLERPDFSILSDEFLEEIRDIPHRNLAIETLEKLLRDEIRQRRLKNVVESRSFAAMLQETIAKYINKSISSVVVIEELINLAKEMRAAQGRGEKLGLTDDEVAFYDALEVNDSAVKVLGDETLREIARELVASVRRSVSIDWTRRESARARIRVVVKRILKKYGYPPDKQEKATQTVLEQAEVLCEDWAAA